MFQIQHQGDIPPAWLVKSEPKTEVKTKLELYQPLAQQCLSAIAEPVFYDEISSHLMRLQALTRELLNTMRAKHTIHHFDDAPYAGLNIFTLELINKLAHDLQNTIIPSIHTKITTSKKPNKKLVALHEILLSKTPNFVACIGELATISSSWQISVSSALAAALVAWHYLPEKLNPVVRPLMDSIKCEANEQLQMSAAKSLVQLLRLCVERVLVDAQQPTPLPKIIKNLVTYLCSDKNFTPEVVIENDQTSEQSGIIKLVKMQQVSDKALGMRRSTCSNGVDKQTAGPSTSNGMAPTTSVNAADQEKQNEILRRGSTMALTEACTYFGEHLPDQLPILWSHLITLIKQDQCEPEFSADGVEQAKMLVQCLQVLEVVGPYLHASLRPQVTTCFPVLLHCLQSPFIAIRHLAARCFGMCSTIVANQTMNVLLDCILDDVLDFLNSPDCRLKRQGACEAICCIIERLQLNIVPYIVFLIVPMLGRMSDQDESVRVLATHCFAQLVQLMPLDNDHHEQHQTNGSDTDVKKESESSSSLSPLKVHLTPELKERKATERHFLEQLMNIHKCDDYQLPVRVNAELRSYQQDGLNWLGFLNKYRLHGIVADEMGLGKTLQAICILASDHHFLKKAYEEGQSKNNPLPSIVICPPTLTGHWLYEVSKFVSQEHLNPIQYSGPPLERNKLKTKIKQSLSQLAKNQSGSAFTKVKTKSVFNLVIASYDLVRNDIDFFSTIQWNYCILDEGHVIKNGKTKLAKAIKSLQANHRLILTGTPIQNNVIELWSLFDFLMPGFLGTERQFMVRYSRPILASRDAKSSSKEQEAGILAMESLHRQVLPFILRRMKEDVLQDLPPKIIQDYYCELSPLQVKLYEDFARSRARASLKNALDHEVDELTGSELALGKAEATTDKSTSKPSNPNTVHIFQSLQYLRKVCNHPKLVLTPQHPQYESIVEQLKGDKTTLNDMSHAAKLCALKQLLLDCGIGAQSGGGSAQTEPVVNQHRALVFCQLKGMLDIVEKDLLKAHMPSVTYLRLDGNVPPNARHGVVHAFNNDPSIDVLLLTTQVSSLSF